MDVFGLFITEVVGRGDRGGEVKLVQEWLGLHGFGTAIDSVFGPATQMAVELFQRKYSLSETGVVDSQTASLLHRPIINAHTRLDRGRKTLGDLVVAYARQNLKLHPLEIGGENRGPWVRLYMKGNDGKDWPWCAGFATFVLQRAAHTMEVPAPHPHTFGCDYLAGLAQSKGSFLRPRSYDDLALIKPGFLFLVRKTANTWSHAGIVESVNHDAMQTIEGNTNDNGSAEGYEVCRRTRSIADKDYLML